MKRRTLLGLAGAAVLAVAVATQTVAASNEHLDWYVAQANPPTVTPGTDVLAGIAVIPARIRGHDYRRAAFGDAWDDNTTAPGGHNGCDTRNDILDRDLIDKTYTAISRCPTAVATGILHDPYTNATVPFTRGNQIGQSVQIDDGLSVAVTGLGNVCTVQRVDGMPPTRAAACRGGGSI